MDKDFKAGSLLAVYGSLRRGQSNDLQRLGGEYLGSGFIHGKLYAVSWYPGVKLNEHESDLVSVDLFRIPDDGLCDYLDSYEGYPDLFDRQMVLFRPERGFVEPSYHVWVYTYPHSVEDAQTVLSGDWSQYRELEDS